jgi:alpha-tubulin suppressor-like RCC1 family protein
MRFNGYLEVGLDDVCARTPEGPACLSGALGGVEPMILGGATRARWREGAWRIEGTVPGAGLLHTRPTFEMEIPTQFGLTGISIDIRNTVAIGALHTCAFDVTRGSLCVGRGDRGQLGMRYVPTDAPEGTPIPTLIGSTDTTCVGGHLGARWTSEGIATEGPLGGHTCRIFPAERGPDVAGVYCMGANDRGQLGLGVSVDTNAFRRVEGLPNQSIRQVYCGGEYTCARTNTELFCWGDNRYGQLGIDPSIRAYSAVPVRIDLASAFTR